MVFILIFLSSFLFTTEQENIFRDTLIALSRVENFDQITQKLDAIVTRFYIRNSIHDYKEHHIKISSLLDSHFKTCRQGSTFNSLLYHDELFLKQLDTAGSKEWSMLKTEEKIFFCSDTLKYLGYIDSKKLLFAMSPEEPKNYTVTYCNKTLKECLPVLHSQAVNAYIITLAKPQT